QILPLLAGAAAVAPHVGMAVGGLLDILVVPGALVGVVGPGDHVIQHVVRVGSPVQHLVHQRHNLSAGDVVVGTEGAVGITGNPPLRGGAVDVLPGSVAGDVAEQVGAGVLSV